MDNLCVRQAVAGDEVQIAQIARSAFEIYLARMDRPPEPMLLDYAGLVRRQKVWVLASGAEIAAFMVVFVREDFLLLDTIAVSPSCQKKGYGRKLLQYAESLAKSLNLDSVRLYTYVAMKENINWYIAMGYREIGRKSEKGYNRIFLEKYC